jgi:hypothetical protein
MQSIILQHLEQIQYRNNTDTALILCVFFLHMKSDWWDIKTHNAGKHNAKKHFAREEAHSVGTSRLGCSHGPPL